MVKKKECKTCAYWKSINSMGKNSARCCHYFLDTGKIRPKTGGACSVKKDR